MQSSLTFNLTGILESSPVNKLLHLIQHTWLLIDETKKQKRLYIFRKQDEELLVFKGRSFKKVYCRFDPAGDAVILRHNNEDVPYRIILCQEDLVVMVHEQSDEHLILAKSSFSDTSHASVSPADIAAIRQLVQQQKAATTLSFDRPVVKKKTAYDLYVERKRNITAVTFLKKLLITLGISLTLTVLLLSAMLQVVEQPKVLWQILPYCLVGMVLCFAGTIPLGHKLRKLKTKKRLKVKSPQPIPAAALV